MLLFGEDVGPKGGVHAATMGLQAAFGERRVFDTSLSEEGIIGRAVGLALSGLLPVAEIQFRKYADPATEQLNNCGTMRWRTHNRFAAPIVVRMPGGYAPKCGDPWHSVCGEVLWVHATGWQVCIPSNAEDAVGLLRAALRSNNPTIFFEHRALLDGASARRPYPGDDFVLPLGKARVVLDGDRLTVVTWGAMVERCERAARELGDVDRSARPPHRGAVGPGGGARLGPEDPALPDRPRRHAHGRIRRGGRRGGRGAGVPEPRRADLPPRDSGRADAVQPRTDERRASQRRGDRGQDAGTARVLRSRRPATWQELDRDRGAGRPGEEGTEIGRGTWLKNVGESVTQNEPLLEITTDKVTVEIAAPATGILREILKSADQPIQAGEVLGRIEVGAAERPDS